MAGSALNDADTSKGLCTRPPFPLFHRSESRAVGDVYRQQILEALRRTHWMIVVVPSNEAVAGFCEIGVFQSNQTFVDQVICIHHHAASRLEMMRDYDQTPNTHRDLSRLFAHLFDHDDTVPGITSLSAHEPAVRAKLVDKLVWAAATLRPQQTRSVMLIHLRDDGTGNGLQQVGSTYEHAQPETPTNGDGMPPQPSVLEDLDSKSVCGTDAIAEIFGWTSTPRPFGDLTSRLEAKYPVSVGPWKANLARQIEDVEHQQQIHAAGGSEICRVGQ